MSIPEVSSYVEREWRKGGATTEDRNPARPSEVVAQIQLADPAVAGEAVESARAAFPGWRSLPAPSRGEILRKAADLLESRLDTIARDFTREEGKTLAEATGETRRGISILRYYAGQTLEPDGETYPSHAAQTFLYARREPLGVVLAITPWNFPVAIPLWKIAPALAYGNTVVFKPSELVPLTAAHVVQALHDAGLPKGVLNMVIGKSAVVGDTLVGHPMVDAISFTGSNAVGRAIQVRATKDGKKVQLELGGKNPAVVLADANLAHAAEQVARGAFMSAGQKCSATSRVIVEKPVVAEFTQRLARAAQAMTLGDPLDPATKVGPVVSAERLGEVLRFLSDAQQDGASAMVGGRRDDALGEGYFVMPTVLRDARPESRVVREEIFGPVAVLLEAEDYEDAVAIANDTPFGLTASLFTNDLSRAMRFASEIRAGVVKINQESAGVEFQVPFGGMKGSSSGSREQGKVARDFFTEWKTVYIDPSPGPAP
jgi:acyl-CoA reductase-like NAD-dependent aldehyde dehydrogenase